MRKHSYLLIVFGSLVLSALISLVFTGIKALYSLIVGKPVEFLKPFIGGGIALFAAFFLYNTIHIIVNAVRYTKDPIFAEMNMRTGISWKDYQALREKTKHDLD